MTGCVYILTNELMPGICKIGCTQRNPVERAAELSRATGVPGPFGVLCYAQFDDFQRVERVMHRRFAGARVTAHREFFRGEDTIVAAGKWLWEHPERGLFHSKYLPPQRLLLAVTALPAEVA